ncbi:hypothetical protein LR48_Vigan304s004000 [Vigna angularis]|uniref:Uncharacterized protein n=1 Tax=Phaseolus angularis TaxID=3914 RepID=A0A0L9T7Y9_PHAAN|nr:hypothetical protein LR48_Vigan304s004000 [Vigna angularis]
MISLLHSRDSHLCLPPPPDFSSLPNPNIRAPPSPAIRVAASTAVQPRRRRRRSTVLHLISLISTTLLPSASTIPLLTHPCARVNIHIASSFLSLVHSRALLFSHIREPHSHFSPFRFPTSSLSREGSPHRKPFIITSCSRSALPSSVIRASVLSTHQRTESCSLVTGVVNKFLTMAIIVLIWDKHALGWFVYFSPLLGFSISSPLLATHIMPRFNGNRSIMVMTGSENFKSYKGICRGCPENRDIYSSNFSTSLPVREFQKLQGWGDSCVQHVTGVYAAVLRATATYSPI